MPRHVCEIAQSIGLREQEVILYGQYKAKIPLEALSRVSQKPLGKLVVVTGMTPTPVGEGKTVTTIGLGDALWAMGKSTVVCIREPSLAPVFGVKGGGTGGGRAQAYPADEINLHFTGDLHAVAAAHNLLAAMVDSHLYHGSSPRLSVNSIWWKRVLDVPDRSLRHVVIGLGGKAHGVPRESGFEVTAASEVMALLSLSTSWQDLRQRLGRIVVGMDTEGAPVTAEDVGAAGVMAVLLREALLPNLVQTLEGTPLLVHTGPFGNTATGCNSVIADRLALHLAEFVVTEAGFGSDLGFEKFCHIVAPVLGKVPDVAVLVATVRAVKVHSGRFKVVSGKPLPAELLQEDLEAIEAGISNLKAHLDIIHRFGVPVVVAINRFPTDTDREIGHLRRLAEQLGAEAVAVSESFALGKEGGAELAKAVSEVVEFSPASFLPVYRPEDSLQTKIEKVVSEVYGGGCVEYGSGVRSQIKQMERWGFGNLPVCFAKSQFSLSHDPNLKGAPKGFTVPITEVQLAAGAGFVRVFCGEINTMPGLPASPAALQMDVDEQGKPIGVSW